MKRKHIRYDVDPSFPGIAWIHQANSPRQKIKQIGMGGLGVFASSKDARLIQESIVDISVMLGDLRKDFKGRVQYCTALPNAREGQKYFLGIEFSESDSESMKFLKTLVEKSAARGYLRSLEASEPPRGHRKSD